MGLGLGLGRAKVRARVRVSGQGPGWASGVGHVVALLEAIREPVASTPPRVTVRVRIRARFRVRVRNPPRIRVRVRVRVRARVRVRGRLPPELARAQRASVRVAAGRERPVARRLATAGALLEQVG